jgi:hypothetical protein
MGKRWEDLIDAAASATEEDSRDLTPVSPGSPCATPFLTTTGTTVTKPLTAYQQSDITPTFCSFSFPVLHSFAVAAQLDAATTRHVRSTTVSLRRVLH